MFEAVKQKSDEFNAEGMELNQRYASAAVIPDPTAGEERWARDPQLYLQEATAPVQGPACLAGRRAGAACLHSRRHG